VITLAAAALATGLAAADGRKDLTTLAAVGATPTLRKLLSLSQAGMIAGLGGLLGTTAGIASALALLSALNVGYATTWPQLPPNPLTIPWQNTLVPLLVIPAVAMLGAALFTRSRLPIERRE
jgi:putative ABC transport system permease protein